MFITQLFPACICPESISRKAQWYPLQEHSRNDKEARGSDTQMQQRDTVPEAQPPQHQP